MAMNETMEVAETGEMEETTETTEAVETETAGETAAENPAEDTPAEDTPPAENPAVDRAVEATVPPAPSTSEASARVPDHDPLRSKLFALYDDLARCQSVETAAAASHKAAKAATEAAQDAVNACVRDMKWEAEPNLFTMSQPATTVTTTETAPSDVVEGTASTTAVDAQPAAAEEWRLIKLADLDLSEKIIGCLDAHNPPLRTIGDVADWTAKDRMLTDVKGIGEAKADKIQDAMDAWFAAHPGAGQFLEHAEDIAMAAAVENEGDGENIEAEQDDVDL